MKRIDQKAPYCIFVFVIFENASLPKGLFWNQDYLAIRKISLRRLFEIQHVTISGLKSTHDGIMKIISELSVIEGCQQFSSKLWIFKLEASRTDVLL